MFNFAKSISGFFLLASISSATLAATAFSILPFAINATVNSGGQASVLYTVSNLATASIPLLNVVSNWHSTGVSLSLSNDNCSGQALAQGGSCTFNVTFSGSQQPSSFTLQPKVCGFNGLICSQSASTFSVNVLEHPLPFRVYEVLFPLDGSTEELVGINVADTSDLIRAVISNPSTDGPLAISPDGSKVYMTHSNGDGTYRLLVFAVTTHALNQTGQLYSLSYDGHALGSPGQIAISPNGDTLFITDDAYSGTGYPIYRIDLTNADYSAAVTGVTDATSGGLAHTPKGIVVSPDGQTVYVANASSSPCDIFSFQTDATVTSLSTIAKETDLTAIVSLLMSSDGSTLYAAGQLGAGNDPAVIEQYNVANNFSIKKTFSPLPNDNGVILSATLSPDNATLYSIVHDQMTGIFLLYSINTENMTAPAGTLYPYHIIFGLSNFNYLSYSPNNSAVAIVNYGSSGNLTALFNPSTPNSVTTVNPGDGGVPMYSHTWGSFMN